MAAYAFSIKRGGMLYGTVAESGEVVVEAIYEPPQVRSASDGLSPACRPGQLQLEYCENCKTKFHQTSV